MQINDRQFEALRAVCDTLIPSLPKEDDASGYWKRKASDLGVPEKIIATVSRAPQQTQKEFKLLLDLFGSSLLGLTYFGALRPIYDLTPAQRESLLQAWSQSRISLLRAGFEGLRKLTSYFYYGDASLDAPNPNWSQIGYPGPQTPPPSLEQRPIEPLAVEGELSLSCDVVVVGSGAGGGVVAGELAAAGQDVIVVDKGGYVAEDEMNELEVEMIQKIYESQGLLNSADGSVSVFAGSCLGGGTVVNWSGAFRAAEFVLQEWAKEHHLPHVAGEALQQSYDAVEEALSVNTQNSPHNLQNQALSQGAEELGYQHGVVARNASGCDTENDCRSCGYCLHGCQRGAKQSTLKTYLQQAHDAGARILVNTEVHRVEVHHGQVEGVLASSGGHRVSIRAKRVVLAAGSLNTPAILMRSGLDHPHLGHHLYLHPAVLVSARYSRRIHPWWGTMMSAYSDEFGRVSGNYGVKIETAPTHPGLMATTVPWLGGERLKERMMEAAHLGQFVIFARDSQGGRIDIDKQGRYHIHYGLSPRDLHSIQVGIAGATRMHLAAGAQLVYIPHNTMPEVPSARELPSMEKLMELLSTRSWEANRFPLYSAHQMGTCRMGGEARLHPLDPSGAFRGVSGLYVADASAFPGSAGTNPMLTIMAMAHHTAQGLK